GGTSTRGFGFDSEGPERDPRGRARGPEGAFQDGRKRREALLRPVAARPERFDGCTGQDGGSRRSVEGVRGRDRGRGGAGALFPGVGGRGSADGGDEDIMTLPQPTSSSVTRGTAASDHRVTSFRDLVHAQEEEEEEEEERSGQQIVGPPRKKSSNELVEDLFRGAKEHGAVAVDRTAKSPGEGSRPKPFAGGGYRLGAAPEEESAYVAGELRQNAAQDFLESIRRGEVPAELRRLARGGQVNLDLEDHRDEDFMKARVMGTSSPSQQAENEAKARSLITIDETEPTTNIQIRLADGGRLVQKFNHSH
ncbi:putative NSFL1 cofactor p47-like protein, partial [Naja naja]